MTQAEHRPDPEFVARLEQQLISDCRRLERLGNDAGSSLKPGKWLRAVSFTTVGLLLGAGGATTAQHLEQAEAQELLQRQAQFGATIATRRVEAYRRMVETETRDLEAGVSDDWTADPVRAELLVAEQQLALAQIDVEEVRIAGRAPRSDVSAPLVGGRDFVSERWQAELDRIAARIALLGPLIEQAQVRIDAGLVEPRSVRPWTAERDSLAADASRLRESLALRQRFLAGEVGVDEAELRHRLLLATNRLQITDIALEDMRTESARVRQLQEVGAIPTSEVSAAADRLSGIEAEAQLMRMEVEWLSMVLARERFE